MRLPQSSSPTLSFRLDFLCLITLVAVITSPAFAQSASQQLTDSPGSIAFGTVQMGQNQSEEIVLSNTGQSGVTISSLSVDNTQFSVSGINLPATLAAGGYITLQVTYTPTTYGWTFGNLVFSSSASNASLRLPLAGAGGKLDRPKATPASVSFGNVGMGNASTVPVVITNELAAPVTLTSLLQFGSGFSASGLSFPMTLEPGQSATLKVSFSPTRVGLTAGSLYLKGAALNIPLVGTGTTVGQLTVSPTSVNFGDENVGSTTVQSATVAASGGNVTISSASSSNSEFAVSGTSFPLTVNAGQSAEVKVVFSPNKAGTTSGKLTFSSNASNPQATEPVTGVGVVPQYSVNLSWSASTSSVTGYNVYRGTAPGSYSKINSALDAGTTFTDSSVTSGATYYYAATAISSGGQESGYSTPVQVAIP